MIVPTRTAHEVSKRVGVRRFGKGKGDLAIVDEHGRVLKGLLPTLKSNFFPQYEFTSATLGPRTKLTKGVKKLKGGTKTGKDFDKHIGQSICLMRKYQIPMESFWEHKTYSAAMKRVKVKDKLTLKAIYSSNRHKPYVRWFWTKLQDLKMQPVSTQIPVRHNTLRLGTFLDLVCRDLQGQYHVVELKTGYDSYYNKHTPFRMKAPFQDLDDSPRHQHQLQLTASHLMYKQTFPSKPVGDPVLLRFHSDGIQVLPWTDGIAKLSEKMMSAIRLVR